MKTYQHRSKARTSQRGGALITSLIAVMGLSAVAASIFLVNITHQREVAALGNRTRARYLAETGINDCMLALAASRTTGVIPAGNFGTENAPRRVRGGRYWATLVDNGDGTLTIDATGTSNLARRSIRAVVQRQPSAFDHAIFAGNSSNDPNYTMRLSGVGGEADRVRGDIYSGGDVEIADDASIVGGIGASGTITGAVGEEKMFLPIPDIAGPNYAVNNDVDVAAEFAGAAWQSNALGGRAWELPEANPAHIFRKNPDDRTTETSSTSKDDFFLEDPYMPVTDFTDAVSGQKGHTVSLSGTMGAPGVSGTDKVYYIDGNLWVHNKPYGRMRFKNSDPEGAKVTFIVKGNVYFSDDVYVADDTKDGVAFIAIKDSAEPDSGNIYLGDPRYGTLDRMQTFLYAENDFIDNNLSATGSKIVQIEGNMTAGNQVRISRDFKKADGSITHSKLTVDFDDRIKTGVLNLPGLPEPSKGTAGYAVVYWNMSSPE